MPTKVLFLVLIAVFLAAPLPCAHGQIGNAPVPPGQGGPMNPSPDPDARSNREQEKMEREMRKEANRQRQEKIKQDTDKLLKLATELKEYVDKSNQNILSLEVVNKAEEIEKLAHSVKDKMKNSY